MDLKECIKGSVKFLKFDNVDGKEPALWYECGNGFIFPIPLSETKGAVFNSTEKAIHCMRWIRPHLILVESSKMEMVS